MARSLIRESQINDPDVLTEAEHDALSHYFNDLVDVTTYSGNVGKYLQSTGSGTVWSVDLYLKQDGSTQLTANWDFGSSVISGTGDIYCNDLHTTASSLYIGDVELTTNSGALNLDDLVVSGYIYGDGSKLIGLYTYNTIDFNLTKPSILSEFDYKSKIIADSCSIEGYLISGPFLGSLNFEMRSDNTVSNYPFTTSENITPIGGEDWVVNHTSSHITESFITPSRSATNLSLIHI